MVQMSHKLDKIDDLEVSGAEKLNKYLDKTIFIKYILWLFLYYLLILYQILCLL